MRLLLLLFLFVLALGNEALVTDSASEGNDVTPQATVVLGSQVQPNGYDLTAGGKKFGKRSYGLSYVSAYTPWYRYGGLNSYGLYGGWYPGWPLWYGSGWRGGWYKGW